MNRILPILALLVVCILPAKAANPSFNDFVGTDGIIISSPDANNKVRISGSNVVGGGISWNAIPTSGIIGGTNYGWTTNVTANLLLIPTNLLSDKLYWTDIYALGGLVTISNGASMFNAGGAQGTILQLPTNGFTRLLFWKDRVTGRTNVLATRPTFTVLPGAGMVFSTNPLTREITFSSTAGLDTNSWNSRQGGSAALTNIGGLASTVFTNVPLGGTNISVRTVGGTNFIDTTGQLNNWANFTTNVWNDRQGGSAVLTNLANNPIPYTNTIVGGTGVTLTTNSGQVTIAASGTISGGQINMYTTNVAGSPLVGGTIEHIGTSGTQLTNGARTTFLYAPDMGGSMRGGVVAGNGTSTTSTYSNSWDKTNFGVVSYAFGSNTMVRGHYSSTWGGALSQIDTNTFYSSIGGGYANVIESNVTSSVIAGGTNNYTKTNVLNSVVGGGEGNTVGASHSVIAGGLNNSIGITSPRGGRLNTISGGQGNVIRNSVTHSVVAGGQNNINDGSISVVGGGNANTISAQGGTSPAYVTIGGGNANLVSQQGSANVSDGSTIGGGQNNQIGSAGNGGAKSAVIAGGASNFIDGDSGNTTGTGMTIGGGVGNAINVNSYNATISGGRSNTIGSSAEGSFIPGGSSNRVTAANAAAIGQRATNAVANTVKFSIGDTNSTWQDSNGLKTDGSTRTLAGKSTTYATVGGTISVQTTPVASAGAAQTNLLTYSVPAHTLTNSNDRLKFRFSGRFAATANTKDLFVIFGSETILDTTAQIVNSGAWTIEGEIIRTGNTSQTCSSEFHGAGVTLFTTASAVTLAQTNGIATTLKLMSTAAGDGDVTNRTMTVEWWPAP